MTKDKLNRCYNLLRELEWLPGFAGFMYCPYCGRCSDIGHTDYCELKLTLEELRE